MVIFVWIFLIILTEPYPSLPKLTHHNSPKIQKNVFPKNVIFFLFCIISLKKQRQIHVCDISKCKETHTHMFTPKKTCDITCSKKKIFCREFSQKKKQEKYGKYVKILYIFPDFLKKSVYKK